MRDFGGRGIGQMLADIVVADKGDLFHAIILLQKHPPDPPPDLYSPYKNITSMSKDFFQRNIELMNELRSEQFKVKEYLSRGKYRMKQKFFNKGKKHYDFDLNSQEYFHEELYDLCFQNSEIQEHFNAQLMRLLQEPVQYRNQHRFQIKGLPVRKNQSQLRHLLCRFFSNRATDLQYEKYLIMQRLHNLPAEEEIAFVKSRINLIDKEIQMASSRADRLSCQDYFEETYTVGGKPVPVNENGQSIYKYLDEEDCWFSNIHRDDLLVYARHRLFRREILDRHFYPLYHEHRHLVQTDGLDLLVENEEQLARQRQEVQEAALKKSKRMIALFESELEVLSPGNLIEKENINSFVYNIFGVEEGQLPLDLPLYPAIYLQLLQSYNRILPYFFKGIQLRDHKELIALMPKLNNFCAILFKYQNKEVLQGKQEVKLGLEDDIDIKKELHTMLEEIWVNKYVRTDFERFDYRYRLQPVDWPLDTITDQHHRQQKHAAASIRGDTAMRELINIIKSTNYHTFRKHLKRHSEVVLGRIGEKYYHMQKINKYNVLTDEEQTLQHLGAFFRIKFNQKETHVNSLLKSNARLFFQNIFEKHTVANAVQVQLQQMLRTIKIREMRVKLTNLFNGMRCYHRNLALDLRVISGKEFFFQLDDQMLINSNKQSFQNFEKAVKDTQTYFSRESNDTQPLRLAEDEFVQHQTYERTKLYKKDRVSCHSYGEEIPHVLVSSGRRLKNKILYQAANEDIEQLEKRILQNCTHFINRYERYIKIKSLDGIVDRVELLAQIYEMELQFQYEKFKLIQAYYYLYENTKEPIQAYKLSHTIVQLIYKTPEIDLQETSFAYAYQLSIDALAEELRVVAHLTHQLTTAEAERCKTFHDKFARSLNIPLSLQAYLYGDLERRGNKQTTKLQRMNSISSRISKDSKNKLEDKNLKAQFEIKQHAEEAGSSEEESFDLENYDEYLLRKNMDAIFDDMIGGDENGHVKEASPVNTIAIENLVVNPRFQGGPHIKTNIYPQLHATSGHQINLVNFADVLFVVGNIRNLIEVLQKEFQAQYGYCSKLYQAGFVRLLIRRMYRACLTPQPQPPRWMAFQTDDPYAQTVTKCMKHFEQVLAPCLDPPSNVQLAIPATFQRHHQKLPPFAALQCFDFHVIDSLIKLKKPVNSFKYKEHNLGINFAELLDLQDRIWSVQLQRRALSRAYQNLARHCDVIIEKSLTEYAVTGQSQVFLATQELKMFNHEMGKYPVLGQAIDEAREYLKCQLADLQVFRKYIELAKRQLENLLIMKYEIDKPFLNKRLDKTRILAPKDPKDIKKLKGRITSMVSIRSSEVLKQNSFLKLKIPLKNIFEIKYKDIAEGDYDDRIDGKDKMSGTCCTILTSKYKRLLHLRLLQAYSSDLLLTANKLLVGTETCKLIKKLNNYVLSVPFLSKLFITPTEDKLVDNKILYDQAKPKRLIPLQDNIVLQAEIRNPAYVYTLQQFLQEWNHESAPMTTNIDKFEQRQRIANLHPPANKDLIFKWVFQIPDLHAQANERDSHKHLINLLHPFTGKLTQLAYHQTSVVLPQPPRNKYLTLMNYYKAIVDYIEANIFLISLQIEEEILLSLESIIKKHINFEQRYFLTDQNSIRQTINSLENQDLSVVYNYVIDFSEIHKDVQKKIEDKNYIDKKQHWVVHDEITDFILSKVQGYGLIRKSYLPLYEDLKQLRSLKTNPLEYLQLKTNNIYKCIHISSCEAYLNEINEKDSDYFAYFNKINQWLCHSARLQDYAIGEDTNNRIDIKNQLDDDQDEKERFNNGIYVSNTNTIVNRLKHMLVVPAVNLQQFLHRTIYKPIIDETPSSIYHNSDFLLQGIRTFKLMGEKNRLKLFARVRYHYELSDNFLSTRPHNIGIVEKETLKCSYYDLLFTKKMFVLATIFFSGKVRQPINAREFKEVYMELKEVNQIYTHNLYENLEKFKEENKIQFSKSEISLIGRNEGNSDQEYNRIIKEVLSVKLLKQELRFRILHESIRLLKAERIPKQQAKRIINTSLIPRVHLISSYSSPLITERKTYISQQYKLSFLQAFINRFRNKVSRVDLLSSGYGFVITVPDLEDCVNYMNKLLFTFTEKEFKNRIETFSQYHDILLQAINEKNKTINQQAALIKYLQNKNSNLLEAEYLSKVTKLLHEKTIIQDKLLIVQNSINGLQDRVRKVVQIQYDKKVEKLQRQNQELKSIFSKVKHLHMINTRQAAKNDFLDIINYYKERINQVLNKKIDFSITFEDQRSPEKGVKVQEEENRDKYRSEERRGDRFVTEDLQRCKLGEDILFDPYYTTKLINKMRIFNLFKMGSKRLKFDQEQFRKNEQLTELHKIQDSVIAQSEREILIRGELSKVQEELSRKCLELQKLKQTFDVVENEKTKLKILMQSKEKKIEQKDREIDELKKKLEEKDHAVPLPNEKERHTEQAKQTSKLALLRKEKKLRKADKTAFLTNIQHQSNQTTLNLYQRFQLSSKDSTWRQKCQQLYIENKRLQAELQRYQNTIIPIPDTPKKQGMSLNLRNRRQSASESAPHKNEGRFPNISFKYSILKQGHY